MEGWREEEMDSAVSVAGCGRQAGGCARTRSRSCTAAAAEEVTQFCRNVRIPGMWRPRPGPHSAAAVE